VVIKWTLLHLFTSYAQDVHMLSEPFPSDTPPEALKRRRTTLAERNKVAEARRAARGRLLVNAPKLDRPDDLRGRAGGCPKVTLYKSGAHIHWKGGTHEYHPPDEKIIRQIKDMSKKSRLAASFNFANAPFPWEWMITLTRRKQPQNPKRDFDKFTRALRSTYDMCCQWGWIMEYQTRHVVHHHLFLSSDFVDRNFDRAKLRYRDVTRRRARTTLVAGTFDNWAAAEWIAAVGDTSEDFRRFQMGGIVEVFRLPDAAARYIAKEAGKRCQKQLPPGVQGGCRWWWLSKWGRPIPQGEKVLTHWPFAGFVSRVWQKDQLTPYLQDPPACFAKPAKLLVDTEFGF
jgi:hypothetical protein